MTFSTESVSRRTQGRPSDDGPGDGSYRPTPHESSASQRSESLQRKERNIMTGASGDGPVLFCFDGSDGSRLAMKVAADLINRPVDAVVLTVWETIATRLALAGAFAAGSTTRGR